jgi:Flp pilus assembly protein CpaB
VGWTAHLDCCAQSQWLTKSRGHRHLPHPPSCKGTFVKRSNRLVIFVGVLLALLAFVGIVLLLQTPGGGGGGTAIPKVNVLVANDDIHIGDPVTPDKVHVIQVDSTAVNGTALGDPSQVGGKPALVEISKDTQVNQESLLGGVSPISAQLKAGEKAIAFQVDCVTGLNFLIQQGDHIDIVLQAKITVLQPTADTVSKPANQQRFETVAGLDQVKTVKTVLQNKRVLYVSQAPVVQTQPQASPTPQTAPQGGATGTACTTRAVVIVAGSDQDAEVIKYSQNDSTEVGPLTATLRSTQDSAVEKTTGITIDRLVTQYGLALPNIVQRQPGP